MPRPRSLGPRATHHSVRLLASARRGMATSGWAPSDGREDSRDRGTARRPPSDARAGAGRSNRTGLGCWLALCVPWSGLRRCTGGADEGDLRVGGGGVHGEEEGVVADVVLPRHKDGTGDCDGFGFGRGATTALALGRGVGHHVD